MLLGAAFLITVAVVLSDPIQDAVTGGTAQLSAGGLSSLEADVTSSIVSAVSSTGYLGVFTLMFLESTSLPVPSEIVLPFAGYLVSTGQLNFWYTVLLATAAGVIGGLVDYYIGWVLGMRVLSSYGSRFFVSRDQLQRVDRLFEEHGEAIIFASRLVPGLRTLSSFPAGSARMNVSKFVVFTALGCFCFDSALVYAGDYLGAHWSSLKAIGVVEVAATVVVLVVAAWTFVRMQRGSR